MIRADARPGAYAERLTVPLRWWVQGTMLVASLWLALVVAVPFALAMAVTAVALLAMTAILISYGSARVTVSEGMLHAGRARIETRHIGTVEALGAEQLRLLAGRDADARAFLLLRPYLKRGVRIDLTDPADPTPYWLVSSRRPQELAAALTGTRTH